MLFTELALCQARWIQDGQISHSSGAYGYESRQDPCHRGDQLSQDHTSGIVFQPSSQGALLRNCPKSWKSTTLPPLLKTLSETWREQYPEWMHVLWLDSDNLCLVAERFPHHLDFYKAFPEEIYRCDLVRNCYMAELYVNRLCAFGSSGNAEKGHSGGIYVDLDYDSFKPLTPLVQSHLTENQISAFLGRMPPDSRNAIEFPRQIYNAFMASVPGHPFWVYPLQQARNVWYNSEECVHGDNKKIQVGSPFFL